MIPVLLKARNPGYTRKDGTYVRPFNDRRAPARVAVPASKPIVPLATLKPADKYPLGKQHGLFMDAFDADGSGPPPGARAHPQLDEKGKPHLIYYPSSPTSRATWESPTDTAVFTPGSAVPDTLNGVPVAPWADHPEGADWDFVDGQNDAIEEPPLANPHHKRPGAGVIIQEPDGRVWIVGPTNRYGGVMHTFPKGGVEPGLSYQATAIKETFEESGLQVEIDAHAIDVERSTSVARYYFGHRVGGSPADMGWESQSVRLVPQSQLVDFLNRPEDKQILEFLLARGRQV